MDIKGLTKIAKACRRLGITHLKNAEVEITLSDILPSRTRSSRTSRKSDDGLFVDESKKEPPTQMSEMDLLFWSSNEPQ